MVLTFTKQKKIYKQIFLLLKQTYSSAVIRWEPCASYSLKMQVIFPLQTLTWQD